MYRHILLRHRSNNANNEGSASDQYRHQCPVARFPYQRPIPFHKTIVFGWLRHHQLNPNERWLTTVLLVVKLNSYSMSTYGDVSKQQAMN